jgi:phenylacetate-CoA ligase
MRPFATESEKLERREAIAGLCNTPPEHFTTASELIAVKAFHRKIADVPGYRETFAARTGVSAESVIDIASFKKFVPITDKHATFCGDDLSTLCRGGTLDGVRSILTSSGHSGVFSFGVNTAENLANSARSIDTGLEYVFGVDQRSTLLINALPMGVKINTRAAVLAETSVREDMVFALIKKFANQFDQIILVAEGSFAKKIIEDGADYHDIDWGRLPVSLITGEEAIAENYRSYIASRIGVAKDDIGPQKLVMSSMGIAELDLNIFHETKDTIRIRRLAHHDPQLRRALFGDGTTVCPMFFVYYPTRCYVETNPTQHVPGELVLSMLSDDMKIPLLRYRTGDVGRTFKYGEVVQILARHGYVLSPELKLPFVAVYGRGACVSLGDAELTPEEVKEALYADHVIASTITGNFKMTRADDGNVRIDFQLRKGKRRPPDAADRFLQNLANINPIAVKPVFIGYELFPRSMETDWERKFRYV